MSIKIKQRDITDCGAACIASISAHYKLNLPVARIRQMASTDKKGTNVLGLLEVLQKLGFQAKGVRGEMDSLLKIPKPAIPRLLPAYFIPRYLPSSIPPCFALRTSIRASSDRFLRYSRE